MKLKSAKVTSYLRNNLLRRQDFSKPLTKTNVPFKDQMLSKGDGNSQSLKQKELLPAKVNEEICYVRNSSRD